MIAGLTWNEDAYPCFCCILVKKEQKRSETLDLPIEFIEVYKEIEAPSLREVLNLLSIEKVSTVYAQSGAKYMSYIYDFYQWRREASSRISLRPSVASSFEAGVLKIREILKDNRLKFNDDSKIKSQLKIFSKLSLKNETEFYAVSALSNVIGAYSRKHRSLFVEKEPDLKAWT
jgi:hypothetical protein